MAARFLDWLASGLVNCYSYCQRGASSPDSDVHRCVIVRKALDSIFKTFLIFIRRWKIQTYFADTFPISWQKGRVNGQDLKRCSIHYYEIMYTRNCIVNTLLLLWLTSVLVVVVQK